MAPSAILESIQLPFQKPIGEFADLLRKLGGNNALSLTLFGTIAADEPLTPKATARSVLVLNTVELGLLRRISEQGMRFGQQNIAAPLIMTPSYIKDSCDTFPLELLDIQQNHVIIFGEDHFSELKFDDANIRHQCERELKVLAMSMRQGLLAATGRDDVIANVMQSAGDGLLRVMRGMLWIKGKRDRLPRWQVVGAIEKQIDCSLSGVQSTLGEKASPQTVDFDLLYKDIETLGAIANAW